MEANPEFQAKCPICGETRTFSSTGDYWTYRERLKSPACEYGGCVPRERALADALFSVVPREKLTGLRIHEAAPLGRGISLWLRKNVGPIVVSGYFPDKPFGSMVGHIRNEDLEAQTFADRSFDLVYHLDVMEHLFCPFTALTEIYRTLDAGGYCFFTAPTYADRAKSEQVAFIKDGKVTTIGEPEYHGNPQGEGSLVTWRYGHDLPRLIAERTPFRHVEVRRWHSPGIAVMGRMTEVYVLGRPS